MGRDEVQAAYFTLLRAREEVATLRRFEDFLRDEQRRLRRFVSEGEALDEQVPARERRVLRHTDEQIGDALRTRMAVIDEELNAVPARLEAAETFVRECENEHTTLKRGR